MTNQAHKVYVRMIVKGHQAQEIYVRLIVMGHQAQTVCIWVVGMGHQAQVVCVRLIVVWQQPREDSALGVRGATMGKGPEVPLRKLRKVAASRKHRSACECRETRPNRRAGCEYGWRGRGKSTRCAFHHARQPFLQAWMIHERL